jgi:hypothetical protein
MPLAAAGGVPLVLLPGTQEGNNKMEGLNACVERASSAGVDQRVDAQEPATGYQAVFCDTDGL